MSIFIRILTILMLLFSFNFPATIAQAQSVKEVKRKKYTYSSNENLSLLVVSSDRYPAWLRHYFRKVDLETKTFVGDVIEISKIPKFPKKYKFKKRFALDKIEPGTYALIKSESQKKDSRKISTSWLCFSDKAPVYKVSSGEISLFPAFIPHALKSRNSLPKPNKDKDVTLHEAGLVFGEYYTQIQAPLNHIEPITYLTFKNEDGTKVNAKTECHKPITFQVCNKS